MDAFLANPGLDPNSKSVSACSYSVQVSDVGAQVESFDNVDEVGATGAGNAGVGAEFRACTHHEQRVRDRTRRMRPALQ